MTNNVSLLVAAFVILGVGLVANGASSPTGRFFGFGDSDSLITQPDNRLELPGQGGSSALTFGDGDSDSGVLLSQVQQSSSLIENDDSKHAVILAAILKMEVRIDGLTNKIEGLRADIAELKNGGNNGVAGNDDKKDDDKPKPDEKLSPGGISCAMDFSSFSKEIIIEPSQSTIGCGDALQKGADACKDAYTANKPKISCPSDCELRVDEPSYECVIIPPLPKQPHTLTGCKVTTDDASKTTTYSVSMKLVINGAKFSCVPAS